MQLFANINGYETVIELTSEIPSAVSHSGSKENYAIEYGNGLKEIGGIVQVQCAEVTAGVVEGTFIVKLPFTTTYDFQATAMNVADLPTNITGESVFIAEVSNGYKVYATAKANRSKTIPVKWSAKGLL